jgi:hypothetical protein
LFYCGHLVEFRYISAEKNWKSHFGWKRCQVPVAGHTSHCRIFCRSNVRVTLVYPLKFNPVKAVLEKL